MQTQKSFIGLILTLSVFTLIHAPLAQADLGGPRSWPGDLPPRGLVTNETNSEILPDGERPTLFYVLPPTIGQIRQGRFTPFQPNSRFCEDLDLLHKGLRLNIQRLAPLAENATDARNESLRAQIERDHKVLSSLYRNLAIRPGGSLQAEYKSGWDQNIEKLREANPSCQFTKIATEDVRIEMGLMGTGEEAEPLAQTPWARSFTLNGAFYLPQSTEVQAEVPTVPSTHNSMVQLSLIGACAFLQAPSLPWIQARVTYRYRVRYDGPPLFFTRQLGEIYRLIFQEAGEAEILQPQSWGTVIEKMSSLQLFKMDWNESDPVAKISASARVEIENEIKGSLIQNLVEKWGTRLPTPSHSASLQKSFSSCGFANNYCSPAAWKLDWNPESLVRRRGYQGPVGDAWSNGTQRFKTKFVAFDRRLK